MSEFTAGDTVTIRLTKVMSKRLNDGLNVIYDQPDIVKHKKADVINHINVYKDMMFLSRTEYIANRDACPDRICCIELSVNKDTKDVTATLIS